MIHGGLRYLAQGDVALVKEAASERQILRRIAPHLARLTPFLIPTVSMAMAAKLRAGLWTFEKLGGVPEAERHEAIGLAELRRREPLMRTDGLNGAILYPEFLTDDARLVLANIRAAQAAGAVVLNYAAAAELTGDGLVARSTLEGEALGARVRAKLVVNAAGAWVDRVRALEAGRAIRAFRSAGASIWCSPRAGAGQRHADPARAGQAEHLRRAARRVHVPWHDRRVPPRDRTTGPRPNGPTSTICCARRRRRSTSRRSRMARSRRCGPACGP
jgi:glycerol-3-phosphate dehydrogenase